MDVQQLHASSWALHSVHHVSGVGASMVTVRCWAPWLMNVWCLLGVCAGHAAAVAGHRLCHAEW